MSGRSPVRFRIMRKGSETLVSEEVEGRVRDFTLEGMALETPTIMASGIHISYNDHPIHKNRIYLQWQLPTGRSVKAVGETIWYERMSTAEPLFVVGMRFIGLEAEARLALSEFLTAAAGSAPLAMEA
jgi:hypothetical protein